MSYIEYFGMKKNPFLNNILTKDLFHLPGTLAVKQRMDYILQNGGIMAVTGDVGIGKSTALRFSVDQYHKAEVHNIYITATSGSPIELYKQISWELQLNLKMGSKAFILRAIKENIKDFILQKKCKLIIIIDEASLLRSDVFSELHTLTQFEFDSSNLFSLVLSGQNTLMDKLKHRTSAALASRIITRAHLDNLSRDQMSDYINHHIKVTGIKKNIFSENALTAIHQGSGGILRKANDLATGALIACMVESEQIVSEEHVRISSTELI